MYEICVGEGGMDPHYFTHTLTLYEAELFIRGLQRRKRIYWEQARYLAFHSIIPHCKKGFEFSEMGQFPWENDEDPEGVTPATKEERERELEELRRIAKLRDEEWLKNHNNGGRNVSQTPSKHEGV